MSDDSARTIFRHDAGAQPVVAQSSRRNRYQLPVQPRMDELLPVRLGTEARRHACESPLEPVDEREVARHLNRGRQIRQGLVGLEYDFLSPAHQERHVLPCRNLSCI